MKASPALQVVASAKRWSRQLALRSEEFFVLVHVDGVPASVDDIADSTGLPKSQISAIVDRLLQLGMLELTTLYEAAGDRGRHGE